MTASVLTRLHITPLNPDLLPIVLGPSLANSARNISYQTIGTFPENNYGFLDLPLPDAKKLVSRLNGAILKGRKMKVEEARPKKRGRDDAEDENAPKAEKDKKKSKKLRKEAGVLEGHELREERKVKRGWTEPKSEKAAKRNSKDKKKTKAQMKSQYTEKEELLFRTKLPANREELDNSKRSKDRKKKGSSDHIVHEFEKTTIQPSFLRDTTSSSKPTTEYVDGVGWVDETGVVVENEPAKVKRAKEKKSKSLMINVAKAQEAKKTAKVPLPQLSSEVSEEEEDNTGAVADVDDTSSSGTTSSEEEEPESASTPGGGADLGMSTEGSHQDPPQIQVHEPPDTPPKVHPLEALFKKPKTPAGQDAAKPSLEIETSFSFFADDAHEEEDEIPPMPATPFTSQDLNFRGIRSAAPTPDTAHPSRFTSFAAALETRTKRRTSSEEMDDQEATASQAFTPSTGNHESVQQSEFEERFWAERGQNNRAWKARRRAAMKEDRQKENRLRRSRNR